MAHIYVIVQPAFIDYGTITSVFWPLVSGYHKMMYENVCGYSLGHRPIFFDTLEGAKEFLCPPYTVYPDNDAIHKHKQLAIIGVDLDDSNQVLSFDKIYTIKDMTDEYHPLSVNKHFTVTVKVPVWDDREIGANEISENAERAMQEHLDLRYYQDGSFESMIANIVTKRYTAAENLQRMAQESSACEKLGKEFEENNADVRKWTNRAAHPLNVMLSGSALLSAYLFSFILDNAAHKLEEAAPQELVFAYKLLSLLGVAGLASAATGKVLNDGLDTVKRVYVRHGLFSSENQAKIKSADTAENKATEERQRVFTPA